MRYLILLVAMIISTSVFAFEAEVVKVVDGDTFDFKTKALNVSIAGRCRMRFYNAPELHGKEREDGLKAKARLAELLTGAVEIAASKTDKYGRWLCDVHLPDGRSVNEEMRAYLQDYPKRDIYSWMER